MGLFSLYKPKEYKYRYIYYDPKKEALKEREKKIRIIRQMKIEKINQRFDVVHFVKWLIKRIIHENWSHKNQISD